MKFPSPSSADSAIAISNICRSFGGFRALDGVSLYAPPGTVFGLVGENGAGKTTLIKHLLGLLVPDSGTVRVLGLDPVRDAVEVLSRIGYLSEARDLPGWMRLDQMLRYLRPFYPGWDADYAEALRAKFCLKAKARIRNLSQGEMAKAGLLAALAYRPELLILDEPSSGLDPVVRREILEAIIRTSSEEGRTLFFSSHLLDEIERVCDEVAFLHHGRVLLAGPLERIKASHCLLDICFERAWDRAPAVPGVLQMRGAGRNWQAFCRTPLDAVVVRFHELGGRVMAESALGLDEIFVAHVRDERGGISDVRQQN